MSPSLRILILTPTAYPTPTGNASTTERWRRFLSREGQEVLVVATEGLSPIELERRLIDFKPEIVHLHHAYRTGSLFLALPQALAGPPWTLVVSPGGTDLSLDTYQRDRRPIITRIFEGAKAIIAQSEEMIQQIGHSYPDVRGKVAFLPKSFCWMGDEAFDLREVAHCGPEDILFFYPAGIRPVKGNLKALLLLEKVHRLRPKIRAVFSGPVIDKAYGERFKAEVNLLFFFARWLFLIPFQAMRSAYTGADIVLNASSSEGLSNALLEAKAAGKPILASDIPGNRWPVRGGGEGAPAGLLFDPESPEHFVQQALRLIDEEELRRALGDNGREQAAKMPTPEEEARGLVQIYQEALKQGGRREPGRFDGKNQTGDQRLSARSERPL
ncbi:MAG: glycosyltransferase family 4 protein [Desulfobacterota bacterium]|nr:glycosyltransferase family 4 protein [Thermodesulfobacteriota bacterium]